MSGDFDDLLDEQTAKKPKQSSKVEPKGDFDEMLDKQKLPEATGPDTVQGGVVFMHPVSPETAKKYADEESKAWYRKADYGLSDGKNVGTISQEEADKRDANAGNAYTLARDLLTTAVSPVTAGLEYGKDRLFNEGSWATGLGGDSYAQYVKNHLQEGNEGEGVSGFIGDPANFAGGITKPLQGMKVIGNPLVRGGLEGGAMSLANQANTGDKQVNIYGLGAGAGMGALFEGVGTGIRKSATDREQYLATKKLSEEDPLAYIFDHPKLTEAQKAAEKARNEADPDMLYTRFNEAHKLNPKTGKMEMAPMDYKDLLKDVKSTIAENSHLPRKMSTITDREAREHLENIIKSVEAKPTEMVDLAVKEPYYNLLGGLGQSGLGAIGGHYVAGIPGAIGGAILANPKARKMTVDALNAGVKAGGRFALTPYGKAASLVPYTAIGTKYIDSKLEQIDNPKKK